MINKIGTHEMLCYFLYCLRYNKEYNCHHNFWVMSDVALRVQGATAPMWSWSEGRAGSAWTQRLGLGGFLWETLTNVRDVGNSTSQNIITTIGHSWIWCHVLKNGWGIFEKYYIHKHNVNISSSWCNWSIWFYGKSL